MRIYTSRYTPIGRGRRLKTDSVRVQVSLAVPLNKVQAAIAQLNRASGYEPGESGFDSL